MTKLLEALSLQEKILAWEPPLNLEKMSEICKVKAKQLAPAAAFPEQNRQEV